MGRCDDLFTRLPGRSVSALKEAKYALWHPVESSRKAAADESDVATAYDICLRHLGGVNRGERRKSALLGALASAAFGVLVVIVLAVGVIYWRGLI